MNSPTRIKPRNGLSAMYSKTNIQVYGDTYTIEDGAGVYITGVDVAQVVAELPANEVLDALDMADIVEYAKGELADE